MTKSALQIARAAYQPKLPKALASGAVKAVAGAATQSVADQEAIKALFPNTYGMPLIQFVEGEAVNLPAINVGVILSGGQAPRVFALMAAVARSGRRRQARHPELPAALRGWRCSQG